MIYIGSCVRTFGIVLSFLFFASIATGQANVHGVVTKVLDCQTVEILSGTSYKLMVRLQGFECPAEGQALSEEVTAYLSKIVLYQQVLVRVSRLGDATVDGFVFVKGEDTARQMLRDGGGWLVLDEPSPVGKNALADYQRQQEQARIEKLGVWSIPSLIPPSQLAAMAQTTRDPFTDGVLAQMAWHSLGPTVEGVFGNEIYSLENNSCGGKVIQVIDGDSVKIHTENKGIVSVRLSGIDAPELRQDFGRVSKQKLSDMVLGQNVVCESNKKDRYGRYVGKIEINGRDVGLEMINQCGAWHYKAYQSEQSVSDRTKYASAETSSRSASCGMWKDSPMAPWEFRKSSFSATYVAPIYSGTDNLGWGYGTGSYGGSSSGGTVYVRSYTRNDGTVVRGHTRSSPGRRR